MADTTTVTIKGVEAPDPAAKPAAGVVTTATGTDSAAAHKEETPAGDKSKESLILGKFKDQAALEAAYTELETKLGGKKEEKPAGTPPPVVTADPRAAAAQAGFDIDALTKEYADNSGKLSDATMTALAAKGITAPMVEGYITGIRAQAEGDRAELQSVVGGPPEDLTKLYEWAAVNLSKEELRGYNALVTGPTRNIPAAKLLLDSMVNRYNEALGKDPTTVLSGPGALPETGVQPFGDRNEMTRAMADPRYATSPAYRAQVEARVIATRF